MNTQKLVRMFFTTLFLGGLAALLTSFFVTSSLYGDAISRSDWMDVFGLLVFYAGLGFVFAVISQTGFFAYLFINRFGLGLFKALWPFAQVLLILLALFNIVYLPYKAEGNTIPLYALLLVAAGILAIGLIIARIKMNETNVTAFIPTLFLMVVMTIVEWIPGLQTEGTDYAWLMIVTLLVCNAYQILVLHRLTKLDPEEEERLKRLRKKRQEAKRKAQEERNRKVDEKNKQAKK